ncbi:forkhead-associated protein [Nostoc sp. NIES-2111]|nr:forkhead-associated protein [Nostoc sp. NIES-2111]
MKVKINFLPTQNEINELDLVVATTPKGECIIGRSPDCDLPLESPDVSRIHGKFFVQAGNYYYCDTGSRNGSIINNKLAEKNQPYLLKHGDSIQIGDYILTMEEIKPVAEQMPETVFRVIDPALFSRPISENFGVAGVTNKASEVVAESTPEVISQTQEEVAVCEVPASVDAAPSENQEIITASESPILEERTFVQPQDILTKEEPETVESDENLDFNTAIAEERTFVQPRDLVQTSPSVDDLSTSDDSQDIDLGTPILQEYTTVQPRNIVIQPSLTISSEEIDLDTPILQEYTTVQPRDVGLPASLTDSDDVDLEVSDDGSGETSEVITEDTSTQIEDSAIQAIEESISTDEINEEAITADVTSNIKTVEPEVNISTAEITEEATKSDLTSTAEDLETAEAVSTTEVDESLETLEPEITEEVTTPDLTSSAEDLAIAEPISSTEVDESLETLEPEANILTPEVSDADELVEQTPEEVVETEEVFAVDNLETDSESEPSQMTIQKNIVLIAHESKKSEIAELVAHNQEFFSHSLTISWPSVSEVLKQQAGINVSEEIPSPTSGGYQKINSLLNSGDVSAVIFLRDFLTPAPSPTNEETLLRMCNINQVLVATNLTTAEAIVHYLKHTKN